MKLNKVLLQYKNVFNSELGTLKNVEVRLKTKPDAIPKFCKARSLPYTLVDRVETKLDRLANARIFEQIDHSDWAVPILPVIKPDSSIRTYGDYKQTINRASDCDKYPIPLTEDLQNLI